MRRLLLQRLGWFLLCMGFAGQANAHQLSTLMVSLQPAGAEQWEVRAELPPLERGRTPQLRVALGPSCTQDAPMQAFTVAGRGVRIWRYHCSSVPPQKFVLQGLSPQMPDALLQVELPGVGRQFHGLNRQRSAVEFPNRPLPPPVAAYFEKGLLHIAGGWDHLLFVMLLAWACNGWRLIRALTGFTLAHAVSLSGVLLGGWSLPVAPVEILIAASLSLLAAELLRVRGGAQPGWALRQPVFMAFAFGLLHGLGFAGALQALGLPADARVQALLLFNLGIESGQLLVALMLVSVTALVRRAGPRRILSLAQPAAQYAIGVVGVVWALQRLPGLLTPS